MSSLATKCDDFCTELSLNSEGINTLENNLKKFYPPRASSNASRCPSCRRKANKFYCGTCVTNKNVKHTKKGVLLAEKYGNYLKAQETIKLLETNNAYFNEKTKKQRLIDEINKIKEDIAEAKKKLEKRNAEKAKLNETLKRENDAIRMQNKKLLMFDRRLNKFMKVVENMGRSVERQKTSMEVTENDLQWQSKCEISQVLDILPVTLFSPHDVIPHDTLDVERLLTYIEEGANTSYMRGEWEFTHQHDFEVTMGKVFTQLLPADGNYLDFYASNKDRNDNSYNISVGLGYLVQFINLAAYCTDIILPRPMEITAFNQFDGGDFGSQEFQKHIYNLNANIFHLCLSQGVPAKYLHPHRALPNVIALMYHPSVKLGRFNPIIDVDDSANEYLEEVEVPDFVDTDDDQIHDKAEADGWEKLTPSI